LDLFDLTKSLIDIPSVTGSEGPLSDFLIRLLMDETFRVRTQEVAAGRKNLLAVLEEPPAVILCTHLDTVPGWFGASDDGLHIYGRGACDAKGIMAAMIMAAAGLRDEGLRNIGLLFVVGEETDSIGAQKANDFRPGSRFIIVGEPTRNKLATAHKSVMALTLTAAGKSGHSAYPECGESAILELLDVLEDIRRLDFGEDPVLGPTLVNIGRIEGGSAPNVIPESAGAVISFRSGASPDIILPRVMAAAAGRVGITVTAKSEPQVLFTVPGIEQEVMPFGTDIPYLKSFGKPLLLGPGSILDAHTENEKVEKKQLKEAVAIYQSLVRKLLEV
jgi:acetylornithine deacetylase